MKWLWRGLAALLALGAAAGAGAWLYARASLPALEGRVAVKGITAETEIIRGPRGVPLIRARSEADAYFALGYVHAQDRLFQMELLRRIPAGRLSEAIGAAGLKADKFLRLLGARRLAAASLKRMRPDTRAALAAYAAGVNAWLATRDGPLPPEFAILGIEPEPWTPVDSLGWGALMSLQLSGNWSGELLRARLFNTLSVEQVEDIYTRYPGDGPVTLPKEAALYRQLPLGRLYAALPWPTASVHTASNAWVVAGRHTSSGKPVLANDPHLGFSAPNLWYLARIEAPGLTLSGATVPGVPFHVLGHNGKIAWGFTTTTADQRDLFIEKLAPGDPAAYMTPDGPRPFAVRTEVIKVKGGGDVVLTVRETRHGPVLSDILEKHEQIAGEEFVLAAAASFLRPDNLTAQAVYRLNRANDWESFKAALRDWQGPVQNITYADTAGNIGLYMPGLIPIRKKGDGFVPAPGWTGHWDWQGFIPFEDLPHSYNPAAGRIANANNRVPGPDYPHFISRDWEAPYRAQRLNNLLAVKGPMTLDRSAAMQADTLSLAARDLLGHLRSVSPKTERERAALRLLRAWDLRMDRQKAAPLIYTAWSAELWRLLTADELGKHARKLTRVRPRAIRRMLEERTIWCDDVTTKPKQESCADIVQAALAAALDRIEAEIGGGLDAWRWGDVHRAQFTHRVFDFIPVLRDTINISIPTDGGDYTLNRGTPALAGKRPFRHVHGAGFRAIFDLSNLDASRFAQATGQSGHPLSPHWRDLNRPWRDFKWLTMPGSREKALANGGRVLTLAPR